MGSLALPPYVELHAASAFSFLEGGSIPEDLVDRAVALRMPAMALADANGVYGAPRFYKAAKAAGLRPLVGAEVTLDEPQRPRLTLLVESQKGYRSLCRLLTQGALGREKGDIRVTLEQVAGHAEGLHCLTGGAEGPFAGLRPTVPVSRELLARLDSLRAIFPQRLHLELQRHLTREEEYRNQALTGWAKAFQLPLVATNGVRYATQEHREIFDVLSCIRLHTTLEAAGTRLPGNGEAYLKGSEAMHRLFSDQPEALRGTWRLAEQLSFTLENLGYRFPDYPLPAGETPSSYLRKITWEGAQERFRLSASPPSPSPSGRGVAEGRGEAKIYAQLEKELAVIDKLNLAGYFLIVWDIVQFCRREKILMQGRGSAANSAVCYALSITAVDPIKMELLFERFLSEERGEWPDIDIDLPSGDQREKVIQYLYRKYGEHSAAMTANVICYRPRSAMREVGKVLGFAPIEVDRLAKHVGSLAYDEIRANPIYLERQVVAAGQKIQDPKVRRLLNLWIRMQGLPRHLGQHSGGMVIAAGRLDEVVPLEPASMPGRVVIQWDKEDCADLGIIKVDLLGLGMLQALEDAVPLIREHEKIEVDLAHLPMDDAKVYEMLRAADTIGLFQVESRAQMASLPRNAPTHFYDIVVQVAIIRPGPIQGGMVHPYFNRRAGKEVVTYPHPCLEPILKRTLGVPLFQEQVLRIAIEAAGFTGGEAEELRRAMGWKRSYARMDHLETKLLKGMEARGIPPAMCESIHKMIRGFASYGFPESHAASFALIAYASAYVKVHHPVAFYVALLNAWPMGFYHPATIVKDAQRHGVEVLPIDVLQSGWLCRWEPLSSSPAGVGGGRALNGYKVGPPPVTAEDDVMKGCVRLGLRFVKGLSEASGKAIEAQQPYGSPASDRPPDLCQVEEGHTPLTHGRYGRGRRAPEFRDAEDLRLRTQLRQDELEHLAFAGALAPLGLSRRAALWQVAQVGRPLGPLFEGAAQEADSPLPEMAAQEETMADYEGTHMTTRPHLMTYWRERLRREGVKSRDELMSVPNGARVRTAGNVVVRQRPGSAKGFVFITLEDETGLSQAIVNPDLYQAQRAIIRGHALLGVEGILQREASNISVRVTRVWGLDTSAAVPSHDFH